MANFSDFYRFIKIDVPGCPDPLIDHELVNASVEFCMRSKCWQVWNNDQTTSAGVSRYMVDAQANGRVGGIMQVKCNGLDLSPKNFDELSDYNQDWMSATGTPKYYYFDDETDEVVLVPQPTEAATLKILAYYAPSYSAVLLPDVLYRRYAEGFSAGATERILLLKGPWSDGNLAAVKKVKFEDAIVYAQAVAAKVGTGMPLRVRAVA